MKCTDRLCNLHPSHVQDQLRCSRDAQPWIWLLWKQQHWKRKTQPEALLGAVPCTYLSSFVWELNLSSGLCIRSLHNFQDLKFLCCTHWNAFLLLTTKLHSSWEKKGKKTSIRPTTLNITWTFLWQCRTSFFFFLRPLFFRAPLSSVFIWAWNEAVLSQLQQLYY